MSLNSLQGTLKAASTYFKNVRENIKSEVKGFLVSIGKGLSKLKNLASTPFKSIFKGLNERKVTQDPTPQPRRNSDERDRAVNIINQNSIQNHQTELEELLAGMSEIDVGDDHEDLDIPNRPLDHLHEEAMIMEKISTLRQNAKMFAGEENISRMPQHGTLSGYEEDIGVQPQHGVLIAQEGDVTVQSQHGVLIAHEGDSSVRPQHGVILPVGHNVSPPQHGMIEEDIRVTPQHAIMIEDIHVAPQRGFLNDESVLMTQKGVVSEEGLNTQQGIISEDGKGKQQGVLTEDIGLKPQNATIS